MNTDALPEADFATLIRRLERGTLPRYGSATERSARLELKAGAASLTQDLAPHLARADAIPAQTYAELDLVNILLRQISIAAAEIEQELTKKEPGALIVARSARRLARVALWHGGKGDLFAAGFAKSLGRARIESPEAAASIAAIEHLAELIGPLNGVVQAAARWLHMLTE
jgi:hypothetical protein